MNYFLYHDYISNSMLGDLQKALRVQEQMQGLQKIYDFGNLVDAMKTEENKVDASEMSWTEAGRKVVFQKEEFEKARLMTDALNADPLLELAFRDMKPQYMIFRERFLVEWDGHQIYVKARCKFDGLKLGHMALDIKTTACKTQASFEQAFDFFDYDRQAAWYMDLARVDKMLYIGVSKHKNKRTGKHDVFRIAIKRGDARYESGKKKYSRLAVKYHYLISNLNIDLLILNI